MTNDEAVIWKQEAESLLNNRVWKHIWPKLKEGIQARELSCNTAKEPEVAADIIRCLQIVQALEREVHKVIQDGQMAEFELSELDKHRKRSVFKR